MCARSGCVPPCTRTIIMYHCREAVTSTMHTKSAAGRLRVQNSLHGAHCCHCMRRRSPRPRAAASVVQYPTERLDDLPDVLLHPGFRGDLVDASADALDVFQGLGQREHGVSEGGHVLRGQHLVLQPLNVARSIVRRRRQHLQVPDQVPPPHLLNDREHLRGELDSVVQQRAHLLHQDGSLPGSVKHGVRALSVHLPRELRGDEYHVIHRHAWLPLNPALGAEDLALLCAIGVQRAGLVVRDGQLRSHVHQGLGNQSRLVRLDGGVHRNHGAAVANLDEHVHLLQARAHAHDAPHRDAANPYGSAHNDPACLRELHHRLIPGARAPQDGSPDPCVQHEQHP
mmetsp:Transcript_27456/g.68973  ORF Transcript_27456/g.68973 Transcript_27456/m.68973 type:complete len:341 (-) Transcript_27456:598-1620(-)